MGQRGRKRIAVLDARLGDLPGQPLGNLGDLGDASPFRNQTWNIDAGRQKAAVFQSFDVESDRRFVHGFHIAVSESLLGPWYAGRRSGFYRARCQGPELVRPEWRCVLDDVRARWLMSAESALRAARPGPEPTLNYWS